MKTKFSFPEICKKTVGKIRNIFNYVGKTNIENMYESSKN